MEVRQLGNTYRKILKSYGYFIESHVSRFEGMLKDGKKFTLYFKSTADASIDELVN